MKPRHIFAFTLAGTLLLGSAAHEAFGQGLQNRLDHVRKQRQQGTPSQQAEHAHILSVLLYQDVSVPFNETPARDAINYLQTVLGINIVARWNDDRAGHGLDPHALITLEDRAMPALTVLERLLEQAGDPEPTTWQLRDGMLEVGTKERLAAPSAREIRFYPIRDLLFELPVFDNAPQFDLNQALEQGNPGGGGGGAGGGGGGGGQLFENPQDEPQRVREEERAQEIINLIMENVEPDAWVALGGEWATIRYFQGQLIIRAPDFVHRQIGGYPFAPRPSRAKAETERRYVTFSGGISRIELVDIRRPGSFGEKAGGRPSGEEQKQPDRKDRR